MPYLLCMSLVALLSGVLNSLGKFVESSAVSIVLNLVHDGGHLRRAGARATATSRMAGVVQAWGVFAAGILQLWLLIDGVRRNGMLLRLRWPRMTDGMRRLVASAFPASLPAASRRSTSSSAPSSPRCRTAPSRTSTMPTALYELPLGHRRHRHRRRAAARHGAPSARRRPRSRHGQPEPLARVRHAAHLPAAVALAVVPTEIVTGLFERGAFTAADTPPTAYALAIFALGPAVVRADQGVLAGLLRARGYAHADALRRHQPDGQHAGLDRAVLPVPLAGPDAAPRHRRGDDARRLAQCRSCSIARSVSAAHFVGRRAAAARALPPHRAGERDHGRRRCGWRPRLAPWFAPAQRRRWCALRRWRRLVGAGLLVYAVAVFAARGARPAPAARPPAAQPLAGRPDAARGRCLAAARRRAITRADPAEGRSAMQLPQKPPARLFRHAADRQPASRQLSGRHGAAGSRCRRRTSASIASSTCTRSPCGRIPTELKQTDPLGHGRLHRRRPRSQAQHPVQPEPGARARRARLGVQLRGAPRLAQPHDPVQGEGRQGPRERLGRPLRLSRC